MATARTVQILPAPTPYDPRRAVQMVPDAVPYYSASRSQVVPDAIPLARGAAAPRGAGVLAALGNALQGALPTLNNNRQLANADIQRSLDKGNVATAAGRAATGSVGLVAGATNDVVVSPVARVLNAVGGGIVNTARGAVGLDPLQPRPPSSSTDAIVTKAAAPAALVTNPVASAMAQGNAVVDTPIAPADAINQYISARLGAGVTNHDLQAIAGIAQAVPSLTKPGMSNKDKLYGTAGSVADVSYNAELAAAKKLPEAERTVAYQKATDNYFKRNAALLGVNMQGLTMAEMIAQQDAQ